MADGFGEGFAGGYTGATYLAFIEIAVASSEPRFRARRNPEAPEPSKPLPNSGHEAFARAIAQGHRLSPAYERAGFTGKSRRLLWELRHRPDLDARITCLLRERVKADTRAYRRREKRNGDLLEPGIRELEATAFQDIREVADCRRGPILNADGR